MKISFIIITRHEDKERLELIINSMFYYKKNNIIEVIVVGETETVIYTDVNNITIDKDFTEKPGWITAKKNFGVKVSRYPISVFLHDYIYIEDNFFSGFTKFGINWDVCMCVIKNIDNTRFMDNLVWDDPTIGKPWIMTEKWCKEGKVVSGQPSIVPYSYNQTQHMYVPGYFWVAKRKFMFDNQLNEELCHCDAEDVEWSYRVRDKWNYKFNPNSSVKLLKYKYRMLQIVDGV